MTQRDIFQHHDRVLVKGLKVDASIGVFAWEKEIKQTLLFDAELYCDFSAAAQTDAIEDAVDYAAVCAEIESVLAQQHYQLLEFLAERICVHLLKSFPIQAVSLSIQKPGAVANTDYVGVSIFRSKEKTGLEPQALKCTQTQGGY